MKVLRSSALRTGRIYLQETSLVLISVRSRHQGQSAEGRIKLIKDPSDTIGIRIPNLLACTLNRATAHPCRSTAVVVVVRLSSDTAAINEVYQTVRLIF